MSLTENLKEDLRKIIGGKVESAFELRNGRGLFVTIQAEDRQMALVVEENGYSEGQHTTEVYVIESMV